jgi:hypothetical protein
MIVKSILPIFKIIEFYVVMSATISTWKRCSVRLCLQLFVGGLVSCRRYLCLFACDGVQRVLCCVFVLFFFVLCIPMLPISLYCPFVIVPSSFHRFHVEIVADITT